MKIAYLDCRSGLSGDMFLGAFLDAGLPLAALKKELAKLKLSGYQLSSTRTRKHSIAARRFNVKVSGKHSHRGLASITRLITRSSLPPGVKDGALKAFKALAEAEARIHGTTPSRVTFHEVGAVDSIIDIVGAMIAVRQMGIEKCFSSPVSLGRGQIKHHHGVLPIPAPATLELLKGISVRSAGIDAELTTPTGAVLIRTLVSGTGDLPPMRILKTGYGAGTSDLPVPNILRVVIGETEESWISDTVAVTEANIDDMNPSGWGYILERLLAAGALDAFLTPVQAKKNRPATKVTVLSEPTLVDAVASILLEETTTIGVRTHTASRRKLARKTEKFKSSLGTVRVKVSSLGGRDITVSPEYDDCEAIARRKRIPLRQVIEKVAGEFTARRSRSLKKGGSG